ncbi:methyl-accepting chemotaxis protein [Gammaproteobacteria bacterium]
MKFRLATRLIALFILLGLTPFLIVGGYSYYQGGQSLEKVAQERLTSMLEGKASQLTQFFETVEKQTLTWAMDPTFIQAVQDFQGAFQGVLQDLEADFAAKQGDHLERLKAHYSYQLSHTTNAPQNAIDLWWPTDRIAQILQFHYIAANPHAIGEKHRLDAAQDSSRYSQIHLRYHPLVRNLMTQFNYYDFMLVEPSQARVVYTYFKETDFATSLMSGPYAGSNLAQVVNQVLAAPKKGQILLSPFEAYAPSYNKASHFVVSPLFAGEKLVGVLVLQIALNEIDDILTSHRHWEDKGLGHSGEVFMVGKDSLLRSNPRPLFEDLEGLLRDLKAAGVNDSLLASIREQKNAIKLLPYKNPVVERGLAGENGVTQTLDYRQRPVLLAYALKWLERSWVLAATMSQDEALSLLTHLRWALWLLGGLLAPAVVASGWWMARSISRPLAQTVAVLSSSSTQIAATVVEQERVASQQAVAVTETNTTMEELNASARQSANQAESTAQSAQTVRDLAQEGSEQMDDMLTAMNELKERVEIIAQQILHLSEQTSQIGTITELVTGFANETRMLAMNAAVEAVRAGEHGKGFSVLAVEIRKLADESKRSAERINHLVGEIQKATNSTVMATEEGTKKVEAGIRLAHRTTDTFNEVAGAASLASENSQQISLNIRQQAEAVRQVVEAMNTLNVSARDASAGVSQTRAGIHALNEAAQRLKAMI